MATFITRVLEGMRANRINLPIGVRYALLIVGFLVLFTLYILTFMPKSDKTYMKAIRPMKVKQGKVKILVWPKGASMREPLGTSAFQMCHIFKNCMFTRSRAALNTSRAVYFPTSRLRGLKQDMPPYHHPDQFWILHTSEPDDDMLPYHDHFYDTFNLMVNDRPDADIRFGSGRLLKVPFVSGFQNRNFTQGKYGGILAATISSCKTQSKAEQYIIELKKYIPVDIYGKCDDPGPLKGPLFRGQLPDMRMPLSFTRLSGYKFYLSFERSICPYYVTNKLWTPVFASVVPVVLGGANYSSILPKHSYIDVKDFPSPKALAEYIIKVNRNYKLYQAYFKWKPYYTFSAKYNLPCNLCSYINLKHRPTKRYRSLEKWLTTCQDPIKYYNGSAQAVIERIKAMQQGT